MCGGRGGGTCARERPNVLITRIMKRSPRFIANKLITQDLIKLIWRSINKGRLSPYDVGPARILNCLTTSFKFGGYPSPAD